MSQIDQKKKVLIMSEVVLALLELENLKPHVSETQQEAADRIRKHLGEIADMVKEDE